MNVVILPAAAADLERIGDTIAVDSPRRAITFVEEIEARCLALAEFPERFPIVPRYMVQQVRRTVHGEYLIFYAIRAETVFILHILHGRMDHDGLLFSDL